MAFSRTTLDEIIDEATQMSTLSNVPDNWRAAYDLLITGANQIKQLMSDGKVSPKWTKPLLSQLIELRLRVSRLEAGRSTQEGGSVHEDSAEKSPVLTSGPGPTVYATDGEQLVEHQTTFREEYERQVSTYQPCLGSSRG